MLRAVKRQGGEQAFNRTARDLVISVCAILAYEQGTDAVAGMFDLIEHRIGGRLARRDGSASEAILAAIRACLRDAGASICNGRRPSCEAASHQIVEPAKLIHSAPRKRAKAA